MDMVDKFTKEQKKAMYEARYVDRTVELMQPIDDPYTPKQVGARFHITGIDDELQAHGRWEDGGSMALVIECDSFKIVDAEE